jgi:hypothetical protein
MSKPETRPRTHPKREPSFGRRRVLLGAAALVGLSGCRTLQSPARAPALACAGLTPFSATSSLGGPPTCWWPQVMRHDLPLTVYEVVERDGRRVLHSVSDKATSGLRCDVDVDPNVTPWLQWTWRVDSVEPRATVAFDELDDSPARVIVTFDGDKSLLSERDQLFYELVQVLTGYAKAATESVFQYPRTSRIRYLVVESGASNAGRWLGYSRNVVEDYRHAFGGEPGRIRNVAVLTDSDDLKTHSEAWYGDLAFSASPDGAPLPPA